MAEAEDKQEIKTHAQETQEKAQEAPNANLDELAQGETEAAQEAPQDAQEEAEAKPAENAKQPVQAVGSSDVYTVAEEGETLLSIANKLKLSLGELKKRNSVNPLEKLRQYVKIHLPNK